MEVQNRQLLNYYPDDDGYTLDAYLAPSARLTTAVRFRYRPTEIVDRALLMEVNSKHSEKEVSKKFADVLASKIVSWDIETLGPDNVLVPMPITPVNILRLKPPVWIRIINIVLWGIDGGDSDPMIPADEMKAKIDREFEELIKGGRPVDVTVEALRKNS